MINIDNDINNLSDDDIITIFEYRYDMGGDINNDLLDRYLLAIDNKTDRE